MENKQPAPPEEQPEIPTQTGDVHIQDKEIERSKTTEESKIDKLMEMFLQMNQDLHKKMDSTQEEIKVSKQEMSKQMEENSKKMEKKLDSTTEENLSLIHI